jgi:hypothetical protein
MTTMRQFRPGRVAAVVALTVLLSLVLLCLSEYFGLDWAREAGGAAVRARL